MTCTIKAFRGLVSVCFLTSGHDVSTREGYAKDLNNKIIQPCLFILKLDVAVFIKRTPTKTFESTIYLLGQRPGYYSELTSGLQDRCLAAFAIR